MEDINKLVLASFLLFRAKTLSAARNGQRFMAGRQGDD